MPQRLLNFNNQNIIEELLNFYRQNLSMFSKQSFMLDFFYNKLI